MDLTVIPLLLLVVTYFIGDRTYDHRSKILFIIVFQKAFNIFKIAPQRLVAMLKSIKKIYYVKVTY